VSSCTSKDLLITSVLIQKQNAEEIIVTFKGMKQVKDLRCYMRRSRSQWPLRLRRGSAAACCWDCGFNFRRGRGCLSFVTVIYCQVEVSVRADHSSGGVLPSVVCPMSVIAKPIVGGHDPKGGQNATKNMRRRLVIY
jgi:hypothetical protein